MTDRVPGSLHVDVVRGRLADSVAEEILGFWSRHGALDGEDARRRLAEVVCVLRNETGEVVGVNSVYPDTVDTVGHRRLWRYRRFLARGLPDGAEAAMLLGAFGALEGAYGSGDDDPIGLCLLVEDPDVMRRHPEAVWPDTKLAYVGYDAAGRQVRVRYFDNARLV